MQQFSSYSVSSRKRNKSGLLPSLYSSLSPEEKQAVKAAMRLYNSSSGSYFLEPEQFYQEVYRGVHKNQIKTRLAPGNLKQLF